MKTSIRLILISFSLCSILVITSCGGDDDSGPSYDFIDQNLQGTIDGLSFTFGEGTVEETTIEGEQMISFDLYHASEEFTDVCDFFGFGDEVSVFFFAPAEVGIYELSLDLSTFSGQTVTLFNPDGAVNNIASIGAVEILTITDTEVTGRMDATSRR